MPNITLDAVQTGKDKTPPRILLYGPHKIGKSSFAANAPAPIFIQTEDGLGNIDVPRFPLATSLEEVYEAMAALYTGEHKFKTLVLDSLDWLEPLIAAAVIRENPVTSKGKAVKELSDYGYGDGYKLATLKWTEFLDRLNRIRLEKNMAIVLLAHEEVKKFDDPEKGTYNYYGPKLQKMASEKVMEWVDATFFASYQITVATEAGSFGGPDKKRVMGQGTRVVLTQEKPHAMAGNRYTIPQEIQIPAEDTGWGTAWKILAERVPYFGTIK